jgi:hypothetical protein
MTNKMMRIITPPTIPKMRESMLFTSGPFDASTTFFEEFLLLFLEFGPLLFEDLVGGATDQIMSSVEDVVVVETVEGSGGGVVLEPESQVRSSGDKDKTEIPSSLDGDEQITFRNKINIYLFSK